MVLIMWDTLEEENKEKLMLVPQFAYVVSYK